MKVAIVGSRTIDNYELVKEAIKASGFKITEVVSGGAAGVDTLAEKYATDNCLPIKIFEAKWSALKQAGAIIKVNSWGKKYNANAGFYRNEEIVVYCDAVIAVMEQDNDTPGTNSTIKLAEKHKKQCYVHKGERPDSDYLYEF